jgi:hypothetical protein
VNECRQVPKCAVVERKGSLVLRKAVRERKEHVEAADAMLDERIPGRHDRAAEAGGQPAQDRHSGTSPGEAVHQSSQR